MDYLPNGQLFVCTTESGYNMLLPNVIPFTEENDHAPF
jgi:hypothetical protein